MNATRLVTIVFAAGLLAGCGNKGPLVLPTPPAEGTPVEAPADQPPAEAAPAEPSPADAAPTAPAPTETTPPPETPATPPVPDDGTPGGNG